MANRWKYPNLLAYLVMVGVNGLANYLPLNNQTTAEISNRYPVLFTPAGYVFSIWGLIYLLLLGFVVYQALPSGARDNGVAAVGPLFVLSSALNSAWIFAWHYDRVGISVLLMLGLLASLIAIALRIPGATHWLVRVSFGVYLGWICVATIANISVALYAAGWGGWGLSEVAWTVIMITVGLLLAVYAVRRAANHPLGLVFVWALIGIGVGQADTATVRLAANAAAALLGGILAVSALTALRDARPAMSPRTR